MANLAELDQFDAVTLTGIIRLRPPKWSLFSTFFAPQAPSETDMFELHTTVQGDSVIPSVTKNSAGVMRQPDAWSIGVVRAPRFRTKRAFQAADVIARRQLGRNPYETEADPVARVVAEDMDAHRRDHDRMIEIMCAQAAVTGKVTLYDMDNATLTEAFSVDYKRPETHEITVAAEDYWSIDTVDLYKQIEEANRLIQEDADGMSATDIIMGADAFAAFRRHPDVVDSMKLDLAIGTGDLPMQVAQLQKGHWDGLRVWCYSGTYKDLDGTVKHYIDPKDALLVAKGAESVIEYGRPLDLDCAGATQYFVKQYKQDDPSGIFTVAESRPLPVTRHAGWAVHFVGVVK